MKQKLVVCAMAILLAASAAAQTKKKTAVKVEYDKFKDITCGSVYLGDVATFRVFSENAAVLMDASYCSSGQKLEPPVRIGLRLRSRATSWLSGMSRQTPTVIFLLDSTDRLVLQGKYEYVIDKALGAVSQITIESKRDELLQIAAAKTVEFQISGEAYKLKQKDLAKLKDLAESGAASQ